MNAACENYARAGSDARELVQRSAGVLLIGNNYSPYESQINCQCCVLSADHSDSMRFKDSVGSATDFVDRAVVNLAQNGLNAWRTDRGTMKCLDFRVFP